MTVFFWFNAGMSASNPDPFTSLPVLDGQSLTLRPLRAVDFEALHAAASDPLIWAQHPEPTRHQPEVFRRFFDSAIVGHSSYAVIDGSSGRVIGSSRYYDWNPVLREIAIGYTFLARSHWGGDANRELKRLMLAFAFRHADTVWFHVGKHNLRSRRAMEKIGGILTREECRGVSGQVQEYVFYRIDAPDGRRSL